VQVAKGFGIPGQSISERKDLKAALQKMLQTDGSFLLEVMVGKENNVFPMVPQGRGVAEIVLSSEEV
jgi:acetolactate synthase-1/2/3 large subunit